MMGINENENMCKCHFFNKETNQIERIKGVFSLKTANTGEEFRFEHENFKRKVTHINFKGNELVAPPIENYNGMDERGSHTFHLSFKAIWGE